MYIYQIFHKVYEKFRGLPVRLSEKTNLSDEWFRSFGYKPKTLDAFGNGNKCAQVEDYVDFLQLVESGAKGAGVMLNREIYLEAKCRLSSTDGDCSEQALRHDLLKEAAEAVFALDKGKLEDFSTNDLDKLDKELADIYEAVGRAQEQARRERERRNEIETNSDMAYVRNSNGAGRIN